MSVIQMHKPEPISKEDWAYYLSFNPGDYVRLTVDALKTENRFFVDERFQKLIYTYAFDPSERGHSTKYLLPGQPTLFRARIYKRDDAHERLNAPEQYGLFQGYDEAGSFVPPEGIYTDQGRINPSNIRYLYTTSDVETSILEVRARPGEIVSVARIELCEPAQMFDISNRWSSMWGESKTTEWFCLFYLALMSLFQRPYKDTGDYYLCQYISEYLKNWGFDGIIFRSAVNRVSLDSGINYTFFNYQKCKAVSSTLFHVLSMNIKTSPQLEKEAESE